MSIGDLLGRKDRPPYVSFHRLAVEDKAASRSQGHYVGKDVDFAHVTPPYSKDLNKFKVSDWFVQLERDARNGRIPQEWVDSYRKQYQAWQNGQELPLNGTPIRGWGVISPGQQETLVQMNILTVEDLSLVNDEGLRRIGRGGIDMKNKAAAWLAQLNDKGPLTQEISAVKAENRELKVSLEALQRQVAALMESGAQRRVDEVVAITASDLIGEPEGDRDALAGLYKQKFGKFPHPAMSLENLKARVAE